MGALHFGTSGDNRFDDPRGEYGVCYAARSLEGAFAETCLRAVGATLLSLQYLTSRSATMLTAIAELHLVQMHGPGLSRLGATAAVSSGTYDGSQPWSRDPRPPSSCRRHRLPLEPRQRRTLRGLFPALPEQAAARPREPADWRS
jgi:hypothetical protein